MKRKPYKPFLMGVIAVFLLAGTQATNSAEAKNVSMEERLHRLEEKVDILIETLEEKDKRIEFLERQLEKQVASDSHAGRAPSMSQEELEAMIESVEEPSGPMDRSLLSATVGGTRLRLIDVSAIISAAAGTSTAGSEEIEQLQLGGFLPQEPDIKSGLYFEETLPEAFIDMCSCGHQKLLFDRLVVDEGQDLLRYQYMLCFEGIIKNGLAGGNWHIAYDPNQNIYNDELEDGLEMISNYSPVRLNLDTNCRNTKPVGIYNTLITGIPPARYFRVDGDNVKKDCYLNVADQRKKLIKAIRQLLGQGAQPGNICLLSKHRFSNSCLRGENMFEKISAFQDITDLSVRAHNPKSIKFSTIHSYKGLESPIVFVLDIDGFCDPSDIYLNYVALTRATTLLYLFYDIKAEEELQKMIRNSAILLKDIEDTNMG